MGWDEKLFGLVFRAVRRRPTAGGPHAARLEPMRTRLVLFGSAIARRKIELRVAERDGHRTGAASYLPERIELAPDATLNARAYLLRVALDATALRLGLEPVGPLRDVERASFALLALPATLGALEEDVPGLRVVFDTLAPYVLALRPAIERMPPDAAVVEVIVRWRLGVSPSALDGQVDRRVLERARAAVARPLRDGESITRAALELARGVGTRDVAPVVLWGATTYDEHARGEPMGGADQPPDATGTEREGKAREDVRRVALEDQPSVEDNPLTHSFEKVHTAEEYSGGRKNVDGGDEMSDHGEALDELEMREVVRSRERAHSLYRAEVGLTDDGVDVAMPEEPGGIAYDEWDERARRYRKEHCRVFVSEAPHLVERSRSLAAARALVQANASAVRDVERRLERVERARRERGRQPDGTEIDIDAVVDRRGALAAGFSGEDRLYIARRAHLPDLAVLVLIDASLSSDAWAAGRRVLDVAKEATTIVSEALSRLAIQSAIAAFFSNTRRDCRFVMVKGFTEPWSDGTARLATVTPTGYTRIGPALRHGARLLEANDARRKLLIMIGDGKPTDFDRYEGRYGMGDVRQAVREAEQRGIHTFALATDGAARRHLPQMFGLKGFEVIARPADLAPAFGRVCADLAR